MNDWARLLVELLSVLTFAQTVIWLNNARYKGPKGTLRMRQILSRLNLETKGFKAGQTQDDYEQDGLKPGEFYEGEVDGYPAEISFEPATGWMKHPSYTVRVCLDIFGGVPPNNIGGTNIESCNWVARKISIGKFNHPSGERLVDVARELIEDATRNKDSGIAAGGTQKKDTYYHAYCRSRPQPDSH